jgi:hypothetical protein
MKLAGEVHRIVGEGEICKRPFYYNRILYSWTR